MSDRHLLVFDYDGTRFEVEHHPDGTVTGTGEAEALLVRLTGQEVAGDERLVHGAVETAFEVWPQPLRGWNDPQHWQDALDVVHNGSGEARLGFDRWAALCSSAAVFVLLLGPNQLVRTDTLYATSHMAVLEWVVRHPWKHMAHSVIAERRLAGKFTVGPALV